MVSHIKSKSVSFNENNTVTGQVDVSRKNKFDHLNDKHEILSKLREIMDEIDGFRNDYRDGIERLEKFI